ncbi:MAG: nucleoside deaminase [Actinobacteria bacterium]|nr:nucleoside deaminase [Actinomycetota bacterium]
MQRALELASEAAATGEVPVGAVVVSREGRILAARRNEREALGDPTAHAEILALRDAAQQLGTWHLDDTTLYVTLEPCPMCAGAAWAARVGRIVFGAADPKAGATGSLYNIAADERLNHTSSVTHGVRDGESAALLQAFFSDRRPTN